MSERRIIQVSMPLCKSERGMPLLAIPMDASLRLSDAEFDQIVVEMSLEGFEVLRRKQHGDSLALPSLDPSDWKLVSAHGEGFPAYDQFVLELR